MVVGLVAPGLLQPLYVHKCISKGLFRTGSRSVRLQRAEGTGAVVCGAVQRRFAAALSPPIGECRHEASATGVVVLVPSARHKSGHMDCSPRGAQPPRCQRRLRARPMVWRCSAVLVGLSRDRRCIGNGRARRSGRSCHLSRVVGRLVDHPPACCQNMVN